MFSGSGQFRRGDFERFQHDTTWPYVEAEKAMLRGWTSDREDIEWARQALLAWDGRYQATSVGAALHNTWRRNIDEALRLTAGAFDRSLRAREGILREKARLLSADFGFKEATATGDHATVLSALENHRDRVGADVMMLLEPSSEVIADTLHPEAVGTPSPVLPLISAAMDSPFGEASTIQFIDDRPYQLVVVPLFTPEPTAWIAIGFTMSGSAA